MKTKQLLLSIIALMILACSAPAALNAYLRADGISGDTTQNAYQGMVTIIGYNHEVDAVRDSAGAPTGRRQHAPFRILKPVTVNSPQFADLLVSNRSIETADLKLMQASPSGVETNYYTYHFTGVHIISIRNWMANNQDPTVQRFPALEEISFTYDTIRWESVTGETSASDSPSRNTGL